MTLSIVCRLVLAFGIATSVSACARGADESRLKTDLQATLNRNVKQNLFEVTSIRREGSAPLPPGDSGASRVVVYYNATLKLSQDYAFGGWEQLPPSSVAYALGAREGGIFGLRAQNRAGDVVRAYGSAIYEQSDEGWTPVARNDDDDRSVQPGERDSEGAPPPSPSKQLIDRLAAMVNLPPPGVPPQQDAIIADELARAAENIERRMKRREHVFTLATGPRNGDYARFAATLVGAINRAAPDVSLRTRESQGSVESAALLTRGEADYAIIQGDVAAAALVGQGLFATEGPMAKLRAVGGLFPEVVHVLVRRDSSITDVGQLRGRRVAIGARSSGTRFDAVAVLDAYGLQPTDLAEANEDPPAAALDRWKRGELEAVFLTAAAPASQLQPIAARPGFRLLPITGAALERLVQERPGLNPLMLPANTYPQQREAVRTAASAALLVTTEDAPDTEVAHLAEFLFGDKPGQGGDIVKVSVDNELRGVTIPLHPGAGRHTR